MATSRPFLRAAFDFGSGASKVALALVRDNTDPATGLEVLFEREYEVLLGEAVARSPTKSIDEKTIGKLLENVDEMMAEVRNKTKQVSRGEKIDLQSAAVCTAVYREASNGAEVMGMIRSKLGTSNIRTLTASQEGRVGYLTGLLAAQQYPHIPTASGRALVWDSGGASFQMTLGEGPRVIGVVEGNWGSSKAFMATLKHVQQNPSAKSVNPVSKEEVARLQQHITAALRRDGIFTKPSSNGEGWFHVRETTTAAAGQPTWIGIGGPTSAFRNAWIAVGRPADRFVQVDALERALVESLVDKSDEQLAATGFPQVQMVVPKLCLVTAVMREIGLDRFPYVPTVGSTLGMIAYPDLWISNRNASHL
jgi:hypothetical protein